MAGRVLRRGPSPITITNTNRLAFGGFGVPVTVTAPPASQADYKKNVIFSQLPGILVCGVGRQLARGLQAAGQLARRV